MKNISRVAGLVLLLCFYLMNACQSAKEVNSEVNIISSTDKTKILKMIIDHSNVQQYYHPDVKGRVPLVIQTHKNIGTDLSLVKFDKPVLFVLEDSGASALRIKSFKIKPDFVSFEINYSIEGVTIKGEARKKQLEWSFTNFVVSES